MQPRKGEPPTRLSTQSLDASHVVAVQPTYQQKAGRSGRDLTTEQWDPMGFTELQLRLTDALRYKNKKPQIELGRVIKLCWNPESQISSPDCRRDTYSSKS